MKHADLYTIYSNFYHVLIILTINYFYLFLNVSLRENCLDCSHFPPIFCAGTFMDARSVLTYACACDINRKYLSSHP